MKKLANSIINGRGIANSYLRAVFVLTTVVQAVMIALFVLLFIAAGIKEFFG